MNKLWLAPWRRLIINNGTHNVVDRVLGIGSFSFFIYWRRDDAPAAYAASSFSFFSLSLFLFHPNKVGEDLCKLGAGFLIFGILIGRGGPIQTNFSRWRIFE